MKSKTEMIKEAILRDGNMAKAITIASKFFDKSADTQLFKQAKSAMENPSFYRQIGKNPATIIAAAEERLMERFCND
jgi:hypothetical protein